MVSRSVLANPRALVSSNLISSSLCIYGTFSKLTSKGRYTSIQSITGALSLVLNIFDS
jgi:hypothetical protein